MSADEGVVIAERQQLGFDGFDERIVIAVGEVGAPDRAFEQHVTHQDEPLLGIHEHDRTR